MMNGMLELSFRRI